MDIFVILGSLFCIIGVGYTSYEIGFNKATIATIEYLEEVNAISFDADGNIVTGQK
tara:strand:+ start:129 stop:296 length:168 start_codon:yes stop_codon:yes gene_type:complete